MFGSTLLAFVLGATSVLAAPQVSSLKAPRGCGSQRTREQVLAAQAHYQENYVEPSPSFAPLTVNVPIVWHVIARNDSGKVEDGNVPESQLEEQVAVLNADYEGSGITFSTGNITRTFSEDWFNNVYWEDGSDLPMKRSLRQGGPETLNVWTVGWEEGAYAGILGYSNLPHDIAEDPTADGIVLKFNTVPGGALAPFNLGRTLTHEAGHWLGLEHTFQDGCDDGDFVADTPAEAEPAFGCPVNLDTCPGAGVDPVHNFMDYTDDDCMTEFTPGQIERIHGQTRTYRGFDI